MTNNTKSEIKNQTISYITGSLGLVAGLSWNYSIKALIEVLFPLDKSGVVPKFIYAIMITIVVVILTRQIFRFSEQK